MSAVTVVKLRALELPFHGDASHAPPADEYLRVQRALAGFEVRVLLPARPPDNTWACGTKWQWEVHPEDIPRVVERGQVRWPIHRAVVCEHQIELD